MLQIKNYRKKNKETPLIHFISVKLLLTAHRWYMLAHKKDRISLLLIRNCMREHFANSYCSISFVKQSAFDNLLIVGKILMEVYWPLHRGILKSGLSLFLVIFCLCCWFRTMNTSDNTEVVTPIMPNRYINIVCTIGNIRSTNFNRIVK